MNLPGIILTEPALTEWQDGYTAWTAQAELASPRRSIVAVFTPLFPGAVIPYHAGDRVLFAVEGGTGYVQGYFGTSKAHDGNTLIAPRGDKAVLLGQDTGDVIGWQAFMLYQRAHADFLAARATLDVLATAHAALMEIVTGIGTGTTWLADVYAPTVADMAAGQPSAGVKGRAV